MPGLSVITLTRDRPELFKIALNNWYSFKYTPGQLEWIIVDDSLEPTVGEIVKKIKGVKYIHIPSDLPLSIAEKRNIGVENASHEIIAHMDDDDYYYPFSPYARAKLLLDQGVIIFSADAQSMVFTIY